MAGSGPWPSLLLEISKVVTENGVRGVKDGVVRIDTSFGAHPAFSWLMGPRQRQPLDDQGRAEPAEQSKNGAAPKAQRLGFAHTVVTVQAENGLFLRLIV